MMNAFMADPNAPLYLGAPLVAFLGYIGPSAWRCTARNGRAAATAEAARVAKAMVDPRSPTRLPGVLPLARPCVIIVLSAAFD